MHPNNHINKLQVKVADAAGEIQSLKEQMAAAMELVIEFRSHLTTSKFDQDPTIQIMDVERRLMAIQQGLVT